MLRPLLAIAGVAASLAIASGQPSAAGPADLIVVNGNIVTVDGAFTVARAVAIRAGRFVAVGTDADVRALAGPATRVIDAAGRSTSGDLVSVDADVCATIRELKRNPETRHIPVIAFTDLKDEKIQTAATTAGATMVAGNDAILDQLPELLEQALQVE